MFLNEGRIVFSLFIILFTFSRFTFPFAIVFLPGCLIVYRLGVWCFYLPKFAVLFRWIVLVRHHLVCLALRNSFASVFFDGFLVILGQKTNPSSLLS